MNNGALFKSKKTVINMATKTEHSETVVHRVENMLFADERAKKATPAPPITRLYFEGKHGYLIPLYELLRGITIAIPEFKLPILPPLKADVDPMKRSPHEDSDDESTSTAPPTSSVGTFLKKEEQDMMQKANQWSKTELWLKRLAQIEDYGLYGLLLVSGLRITVACKQLDGIHQKTLRKTMMGALLELDEDKVDGTAVCRRFANLIPGLWEHPNFARFIQPVSDYISQNAKKLYKVLSCLMAAYVAFISD